MRLFKEKNLIDNFIKEVFVFVEVEFREVLNIDLKNKVVKLYVGCC